MATNVIARLGNFDGAREKGCESGGTVQCGSTNLGRWCTAVLGILLLLSSLPLRLLAAAERLTSRPASASMSACSFPTGTGGRLSPRPLPVAPPRQHGDALRHGESFQLLPHGGLPQPVQRAGGTQRRIMARVMTRVMTRVRIDQASTSASISAGSFPTQHAPAPIKNPQPLKGS